MALNDNELADNRNDQPVDEHKVRPLAWRSDDDDDIEEADLETSFLFTTGDVGNLRKPIREGEGYGGQKFGENNLTPAGDDKNNPSQNAGYSNAYFARTEPSEEHPEDSNFTAQNQDNEPDYSKAQPQAAANSENPKPEAPERGNGENDRPHPQEPYREGTADNEETNAPGPNELPDQQKVGEDTDDDREHIET